MSDGWSGAWKWHNLSFRSLNLCSLTNIPSESEEVICHPTRWSDDLLYLQWPVVSSQNRALLHPIKSLESGMGLLFGTLFGQLIWGERVRKLKRNMNMRVERGKGSLKLRKWPPLSQLLLSPLSPSSILNPILIPIPSSRQPLYCPITTDASWCPLSKSGWISRGMKTSSSQSERFKHLPEAGGHQERERGKERLVLITVCLSLFSFLPGYEERENRGENRKRKMGILLLKKDPSPRWWGDYLLPLFFSTTSPSPFSIPILSLARPLPPTIRHHQIWSSNHDYQLHTWTTFFEFYILTYLFQSFPEEKTKLDDLHHRPLFNPLSFL